MEEEGKNALVRRYFTHANETQIMLDVSHGFLILTFKNRLANVRKKRCRPKDAPNSFHRVKY